MNHLKTLHDLIAVWKQVPFVYAITNYDDEFQDEDQIYFEFSIEEGHMEDTLKLLTRAMGRSAGGIVEYYIDIRGEDNGDFNFAFNGNPLYVPSLIEHLNKEIPKKRTH